MVETSSDVPRLDERVSARDATVRNMMTLNDAGEDARCRGWLFFSMMQRRCEGILGVAATVKSWLSGKGWREADMSRWRLRRAGVDRQEQEYRMGNSIALTNFLLSSSGYIIRS